MKSLLLTVSLVLLSNIVFGQETSKKYQKYKAKYGYEEGYIKTLQGEKVSGLIKRPGGLGIKEYKKVVFISKEGTRYAYAPYNIQGYEFGHQQYISGRSHFYKRISGSDEVGLYEKQKTLVTALTVV